MVNISLPIIVNLCLRGFHKSCHVFTKYWQTTSETFLCTCEKAFNDVHCYAVRRGDAQFKQLPLKNDHTLRCSALVQCLKRWESKLLLLMSPCLAVVRRREVGHKGRQIRCSPQVQPSWKLDNPDIVKKASRQRNQIHL